MLERVACLCYCHIKLAQLGFFLSNFLKIQLVIDFSLLVQSFIVTCVPAQSYLFDKTNRLVCVHHQIYLFPYPST